MTAQLLDGRATSAAICDEVRAGVEELEAEHGVTPGLATILVGEDPGSKSYVGMKQKQCEKAGMRAFGRHLPEDVSQEELERAIEELNADPNVHGILIQLPLPDHLDEESALAAIALEKDVDGFHPVNIERLTLQGMEPTFAPCMPLGCIELLDRYDVEIEGKEAVVLGPSNIVGLPTALLLLHRGATLTICHSHTKNLAEISKRADILVAAIDQPRMVKAAWVKPGAAVIDVGWSRVKDSTAKKGYRVVGNVDFDAVNEVAGHLTPVPGGTGPMTIALLLRNTLISASRQVD
ncbi:MAG: bifunctional 5,10-methylenetetrahydrofolate dehydrogenase/5,10-methenyltetrahydrofolate cyclohydrolase, partial [Chloroflexota bacterium]|nr:bifunctional 5,10-methylenetetrahydrofolate dehydrogenase/5,10-methenyltetrahydrofolate cyclohydrolase [Chloroflexota bacterium]